MDKKSGKEVMKIRVLYLISEADPLVKIGGLGDVGGSLPGSLRALAPSFFDGKELDIRLAIPYYASIQKNIYEVSPVADYSISRSGLKINARAYGSMIGGVPVYLIDGNPVINDPPVYSTNQLLNGDKFIFFSLASLELARRLDWSPHIVHANDWHTCPAVYWLHLRRGKDPFFDHTRTLLTVHNLPYMGNDTSTILSAYNLPPSDNPKLPVWARHLPLPMGLASADRIVAVSKGYAQEILTPEHGSGLDGFLKSRKGAISGILNGLNTEVWDPRKDPLITCNFDQSDIDPRQENKASLLKELGLDENPDLPLLAFIGRMDPQKGIDIILDALRSMTIMPWQAILLGTGIPSLEEACRRFQNELPHRVRSVIRFDAALSHWLFSGADVLMVPSRYEPCGIVQMIAMRYGCLPLAHNTGGLRDTIQDIGAAENGNGFLFEPATATALAAAIQRVLILYGQPQRWKQVQMNAMAEDYSWHQSAAAYAKLYTDLYKEGKQ